MAVARYRMICLILKSYVWDKMKYEFKRHIQIKSWQKFLINYFDDRILFPFQSGPYKTFVAAIDFGTTFSGLAFSCSVEQTRNTNKIHLQQWPHQGPLSAKAPTSVLFNPDKTLHSFGYEAEEFFHDESSDSDLTQFYFFKNFKMYLYDNQVILCVCQFLFCIIH